MDATSLANGEKLCTLLEIAYYDNDVNVKPIKQLSPTLVLRELRSLHVDANKTIPAICLELIAETPKCVSVICNDTTPLIEACKSKVTAVINAILHQEFCCNPEYITDEHSRTALYCLLTSYCGVTISKEKVEEFAIKIVDMGGLSPTIAYGILQRCCNSRPNYPTVAMYILQHMAKNAEKYNTCKDINHMALISACNCDNCEDVAILCLQYEIEKNTLYENKEWLGLVYEYAKRHQLINFLEKLTSVYVPPTISYNKIKHKIVSNPTLLIGLEVTEKINKDIKARFNHKSWFPFGFGFGFGTKGQGYSKYCRILYPEEGYSCDYISTRINIYLEENSDGKFIITRYGYG